MSARRFDGPAYSPDHDDGRLLTQNKRVWNYMLDGGWHTHADIAMHTGAPQPSVLAQLGHLRKPRFGGHTVERRSTATPGLYEYRLIPNGPLLDGLGAATPRSNRLLREEVVDAACAAVDNPTVENAQRLSEAVRKLRA